MDASIKQILSNNRADGVFQTHVSMIEPRGSFHFQHNTFPTFWENYCSAIHSDEDYVHLVSLRNLNLVFL